MSYFVVNVLAVVFTLSIYSATGFTNSRFIRQAEAESEGSEIARACIRNRINSPQCRHFLSILQQESGGPEIARVCRGNRINSPQCRQFLSSLRESGGPDIARACRGNRINSPQCRQFLSSLHGEMSGVALQGGGGSHGHPPNCKGNRRHRPECQAQASGENAESIEAALHGGGSHGHQPNCKGNRRTRPECLSLMSGENEGPTEEAVKQAFEEIKWLGRLAGDNMSLAIPGLPKTPTGASQQSRFQIASGVPDVPFQACKTPTRKMGHCRYLQHCVLPEFTTNFNVFLRYVCFIEGLYVGVCCPDSRYPDLVTRPPIPTTPATTTPRPPTPPNSRGCGINSFQQTKIVGGQTAELNKYPWIAALLKGPGGTPSQYCGGVLISNKHVITAAHCVDGFEQSTITVRLGEYNFDEQTTSEHKDFKLSSLKMHENYDRQTFVNDIAILTLERTTDFSKSIWPVCLPPTGQSFVGETVTAVGWGTIYFGGPVSPILKEVNIPVWTNEDCKAAYKDNEIFPLNLCAGDKAGGKDSCQGDSGGPLMMQFGPEKRWITIGVVSWGIRCAEPGVPGVYTRISEFLQWIKENSPA